jgi:hypothetical protein
MAGTYLDFLREQFQGSGGLNQFQDYFDMMMKRDPNFRNLLDKQYGDNPFMEMQKYLKGAFPDRPDLGGNIWRKFFKQDDPNRRKDPTELVDPIPPVAKNKRWNRGMLGGFHGISDGKGGVWSAGRDNPRMLHKILYG